jgi:hypothetical protein
MNLEDKISQTYQLIAVNQGLRNISEVQNSTASKLEATV